MIGFFLFLNMFCIFCFTLKADDYPGKDNQKNFFFLW